MRHPARELRERRGERSLKLKCSLTRAAEIEVRAGAQCEFLAGQDGVAARQQRREPVGWAVLERLRGRAAPAPAARGPRSTGRRRPGRRCRSRRGAPARGSGRRRVRTGRRRRRGGRRAIAPASRTSATSAPRSQAAAASSSSELRVDHRDAGHRDGARSARGGAQPPRRAAVADDDDLADVVAGEAADDVAAGRRAEPPGELPLDEAERASRPCASS